jgi:uncharacterized protein Usg
LFGSLLVFVLVQLLPLGQYPVLHSHLPFWQVELAGQVCKQLPQLFGSLLVLVQLLPLGQYPLLHSQLPFWQVELAGQVCKQLPQLFGSDVVSTQEPPQYS